MKAQQGALFDAVDQTHAENARYLARKADAESSALAALEMLRSGAHATQIAQVLALCAAHPHLTARELAGVTYEQGWPGPRLDRYQVQRRLSDLKSAGHVQHSAVPRDCRLGKPAVSWWITETGRAELAGRCGGDE